MGFFSDAQGQISAQSLVESGRNSNSSEILWFSSIPASMKTIRLKIKALECYQDYISGFFRRSKAANSEVSGGILQKFKLIQAFKVALVTFKNEEDPIKNEGARVLTTFFSL